MAQPKSTNLNLRMSTEVREALREAAVLEHRSIAVHNKGSEAESPS